MAKRRTKSTLPKWLCVDSKCVFADVKITTVRKPPFASAQFTRSYEQMTVFCKKKQRYVRKYVTRCPLFMNTTLNILFSFKDNR